MRIRMTSMCLALALAGSGCVKMNRDAAAPVAPDDRGLVAHWTFDEGSGAVAKDVTGHGHDAALKNVEWVPSPRGHAARFTTKDSLAQYGNTGTMNLGGDMTLAIWVKTDVNVGPNTYRLIFGDNVSTPLRSVNLALSGENNLSLIRGDGSSGESPKIPAPFFNGYWKHVVAVLDFKAGQITFYVDGTLVAEQELRLPSSKLPPADLITGWFYDGFFQGDLDDIRLYSRALAADEVQELFQSQADIVVDPATLEGAVSARELRGVASVNIRNLSKEPRRIEVNVPDKAPREIALQPGEQRAVALEGIPLKSIWAKRNDLYFLDSSQVGFAPVLGQ